MVHHREPVALAEHLQITAVPLLVQTNGAARRCLEPALGTRCWRVSRELTALAAERLGARAAANGYRPWPVMQHHADGQLGLHSRWWNRQSL